MKMHVIILFFAGAIFLTGCRSDMGVYHIGKDKWFNEQTRTALNDNSLSIRSRDFLMRHGLAEEYDDDPVSVIKKLDSEMRQSIFHGREQLLTLIELCYLQGKDSNDDEAIKYYLSSCIYSYSYLFSKKVGPDPLSPYSSGFIFACRYYNYSLAEILEYFQSKKLPFSKEHTFFLVNGKVTFTPAKSDFPLGHYNKFLSCFEYSPRGMLSYSRSSGLGMPLIGVLEKEKNRRKVLDFFSLKDSKSKKIHISTHTFMMTLFIRFAPDNKGHLKGQMEFYDTLHNDWIKVADKDVPLEIDITTPLGYVLEKGPMIKGFKYMLDPNAIGEKQGLYMLTPYREDKIPLVFVHGLMSRPRTWVQMINILLRDKKIRDKYQIWLFAYPTGNPFMYSAMLLRKALVEVHKKYDPEGKNPNFNRMVLVSHSMGGLLSQLMVKESGDKLVKAFLRKPLDELDIPEEDKKLIKEVAIFERLPFVKRIVFMSVPHRGSEMATWSISRFGSSMITLPHRLTSGLTDLIRVSALKIEPGTEEDFRVTGIDSLSPENKMLKLMGTIPFPTEVKYHTICGNEDEAGVPNGTDGIVPYKSSHQKIVESELIVKSGHSTQLKPLAIQEVKRILLLHLNEK